MLDVLALNKEVLGFTNIWYESALRHASALSLPGGAKALCSTHASSGRILGTQ
jgi:hypothetical protein